MGYKIVNGKMKYVSQTEKIRRFNTIENNDRKSYCPNSAIFYAYVKNYDKQRLSDAEFSRQQEYVKNHH